MRTHMGRVRLPAAASAIVALFSDWADRGRDAGVEPVEIRRNPKVGIRIETTVLMLFDLETRT
jgi:hypothetical protein